MAWRVDAHLIHGEIDNRIPGRVTGRLWFVGRGEPVVMGLQGNAWRDVAGHVLRFDTGMIRVTKGGLKLKPSSLKTVETWPSVTDTPRKPGWTV